MPTTRMIDPWIDCNVLLKARYHRNLPSWDYPTTFRQSDRDSKFFYPRALALIVELVHKYQRMPWNVTVGTFKLGRRKPQ